MRFLHLAAIVRDPADETPRNLIVKDIPWPDDLRLPVRGDVLDGGAAWQLTVTDVEFNLGGDTGVQSIALGVEEVRPAEVEELTGAGWELRDSLGGKLPEVGG